MKEQIYLGHCPDTNTVYARRLRYKTEKEKTEYEKENPELTTMPDSLKDKDLKGIVFKKGKYSYSGDILEEKEFKANRDNRRRAYDSDMPIRDQLDAIWETFNYLRLNGIDIPPQADSMLGKRQAIKMKYPVRKKR